MMNSAQEAPTAKASGTEDQSDGIVVSFGSEWHEPLLHGSFTAVIRKRIPKTAKPKWLYFHINAPVGAICARAEIRDVYLIPAKKAMSRCTELALQPEAVAEYLGGSPAIGFYALGRIYYPRHPPTSSELTQYMTYHPPQSFFFLSRNAKTLIDKLAGFKNATSKMSSGRQ